MKTLMASCDNLVKHLEILIEIIARSLTYESYINPVIQIQKKVLRAISLEHSTSPSSPVFLNRKILRLPDLFQQKLLSFVYDSVNKISPACFHSFFPLVESIHQHGTRQVIKTSIFVSQKNTLQYSLTSMRYHAGTTFQWK